MPANLGDFQVGFELDGYKQAVESLSRFRAALDETTKKVIDNSKEHQKANKENTNSWIGFNKIATIGITALYANVLKYSPAIQAHMTSIGVATQLVGIQMGESLSPMFQILENLAWGFTDWYMSLDEGLQTIIAYGVAVGIASKTLKTFLPANFTETLTSLEGLSKIGGIGIAFTYAKDAFDDFNNDNILGGIESAFTSGGGIAMAYGKYQAAGALFVVTAALGVISDTLTGDIADWKANLENAAKGGLGAAFLSTAETPMGKALFGFRIAGSLYFTQQAISDAIKGDFLQMTMNALIGIGFLFPNPVTLAAASVAMFIKLFPDTTEFFQGLPGSETIRKWIWGESGTFTGWLSDQMSTKNTLNNEPKTKSHVGSALKIGAGLITLPFGGTDLIASALERQSGGMIPHTGLYQMHAGEQVIPAGLSRSGGGSSGDIYVTNNNIFYGNVLGDRHKATQSVEQINQTMKNSLKTWQSTGVGGRF